MSVSTRKYLTTREAAAHVGMTVDAFLRASSVGDICPIDVTPRGAYLWTKAQAKQVARARRQPGRPRTQTNQSATQDPAQSVMA